MYPFYVDLVSNAQSDEENTVANFKNKIQLLNPLIGNWEVALVEISYTKSWRNLRHDFSMALEIFNQSKKSMSFRRLRQKIDSGYYESIEHLIKEINTKMALMKIFDDKNPPKISFNEITKKIDIMPGFDKENSLLFPNLSDELAEIFGFEDYTYTSNSHLDVNNYAIPERPADMEANLNTLYIYSDIVEPQYVGDTRAKLLRAVGVPSDCTYGQQILVKYDRPHYIPILTNEFETIEIDIKDDTNERFLFMFGRTRLKLHFRPRDDK